MTILHKPEGSELGKHSQYDTAYNPDKLFPIARHLNRESIGIKSTELPFFGYDIWNHYEVSWLNDKGKPIVALAEIIYSCTSPNIVESKSMKLYFNSFNQSHFKDAKTLQAVIFNDLTKRLETDLMSLRLIPLNEINNETLFAHLEGINLDDLDIICTDYHHQPSLLKTKTEIVEETLQSNLLKSNCLVTNQPDWCSIQISYKGPKIDHEGLLRYLVSFRNDNEFHEQCIEKIYLDLLTRCKPSQLIVYGRSTRRGGIDINAIRSSHPIKIEDIKNIRLCRQ